MTGLMFEVKITAVGEVRDSDGNLITPDSAEFDTMTMTAQELLDNNFISEDDLQTLISQGDSK